MTVQYGQLPQVNNFGQMPNQATNSIMQGWGQNQYPVNPMTGLRFEDPTGMLGMGSAGLGVPTIGDIGKSVSQQNWGMPAATGAGPTGSGFGMNMPTLALGLQGLNSLGSLYMGNKSLDLANKQFESSQKFANANLANQTQSYNDTLENKLRRIGSFNQTAQADTDAEIARRKLPNRV
jgi:hypothetical protein